MNIIFNEKAKIALKELMASKESGVIRLKVLAFGWGKPALGFVLDEQKSEDIVQEVDGVTFVVEENQQIYFENTEILYNPQVFNNDGFYIHQIRQYST